MKILIYSPRFHPCVGGLETVASILAHEFVALGHEVQIVSQTPDLGTKLFPFPIIRQPKLSQLLALTHWCNIYFQICVSLKGIWPLLLLPKPLVIAHHTWYQRSDGTLAWQDVLKLGIARLATNISISQAMADHLSSPSVIIPNPYEEDIFHQISAVSRTHDLVFLGRLVSDKGVDLLLKALAILKQDGLTPSLTIIGIGPEESTLRYLTAQFGLIEQITFVGLQQGQELVQLLNAHKILVIPSRWQEPFGVVALEGIACGCVVVGSEDGGLKDAIGPCGVTFPNGDVNSLTKALANLLTHPEHLSHYREQSVAHLARHRKTEVAKTYLRVFEEAL